MAAIDEPRGAASGYRIYNLGGSRTTSLRRLVDLLSAGLDKEAKVRWLPAQPGDMLHTLADVSLAGRALGYAPKVPIEEGIRRFIDWVRK